MPMQQDVLERCIERIKAFQHGGSASLFRVDADDAAMLRDRQQTRIVACPQEYIYAPAWYDDLSGGAKEHLRRELKKLQQQQAIEVLDYCSEFAGECKDMLKQWARLQQEKYQSILYGPLTHAFLDHYPQFSRTDLFGKVIRVDGVIRSFGFAGEIRRQMGNVTIAYSDLRIRGLNRMLWIELLRAMKHLDYANGSHAGDTPGLAFAKQSLGPALMFQPYQIYAG